MNTFLKFAGGLVLGAALGAGAYLIVTKDSEEGLVADIKQSIQRAIEEGKRSAEERRKQLEMELGFSVDDETPAIPASAPQPAPTPAPQTSSPA